jgi:hypothetical protein
MVGLTLNPTASVGYANLAYAIEVVGVGSSYSYGIWENGVPQITSGPSGTVFGSYSPSTIFDIIYDGKHVSYYCAGQLVRTVPISSQTFFMEVDLGNQGDVISNLAFGPLSQATQPFTLIALTGAVSCSGNTAYASNQITTAGFGARCFTSNESYSNGCTVAGRITAPVSGASYLGLTNSPVVGVDQATAAWYPHPDVGGYQILYAGLPVTNPATGTTIFGATVSASDVLTVEYDTFFFYWYRNNTLIWQQYSPNAGALYLFGDMFYPNSGWSQLSFTPNGALTPNPFLATGSCVTHDSTASKSSSGASAWDSAIYSLNAYLSCHIQAKVSTPTNTYVIVGLTPTPPPISTHGSSYLSLYYSFESAITEYLILINGIAVPAANVPLLSGAVPVYTDLLAVTYDGSHVNFILNGATVYTIAVTGDPALYGMAAFYTPGASINSLSFGPGTTLDTVPTASIDPNAVSQIVYAANFASGNLLQSNNGALAGDSSELGINTTGGIVSMDLVFEITLNANAAAYLTGLTMSLLQDQSSIGLPLVTFATYDLYKAFSSNPSSKYTVTITLVGSIPSLPANGAGYGFSISGTSGAPTNTILGTYTGISLKIREYKK